MSLFKKKELIDAQRKILDNFFEIKGDVASFDLNYKSIYDLVDENFKSKKLPIIHGNFYDEIKHYTSLLPSKYKIQININIEDLHGYSLENMQEIFADNRNLFLIRKHQMNKNNVISSLIMLLLGSFFFVIYSIGIKFGCEQIFNEFIYIACWVFYWEAVSIIFMEIFGEERKLKKFVKRIAKLNITSIKQESK